MKIVVNRAYGGFSVSDAVMDRLGLPYTFPERKGRDWNRDQNFLENEDLGIVADNSYAYRADPRLIAAIEALGEQANGRHSPLEVVEVPDEVDWEIEEYDGMEWVSERHRTW